MPRCPASGLIGPALLALACVFPGRARAQDAALPPATISSSQAVTGSLPNGLRYVVLPHDSPRGDLSLRLVVQAGSLDEHDDERGFAHFVEHMGFNGTRSHPPGSVQRFFEKLGLTWGADLNAHTTPTHTVYLLDLPAGRAGELPEALGVLRDYADGMLFPADEVTREAPVVLSELRTRDNPAQRLAHAMIDVLYAGTAAPTREVGGLPEQIARATPAALRAFYERNYRADRFTLVIVGPVDSVEIIPRIATAFGTVATPTESRAPAPAPLPTAASTLAVDLVPAPGTTALVVDLISIQRRPPDDPAGRRDALLQAVAARAFNSRLNAALDASASPFGAARVEQSNGPSAVLVQHQIEVQTSPDHGPEAIAFAELELRRLREYGLLQEEVDEAAAAQLAAARNAASEFASQSSAQVSAQIERSLLAGRAWRSPLETLPEIEAHLGRVTAAEVSAAARALFADGTLHLVLRAPRPLDGGVAAARAAFEKSARQRVVAPLATSPSLRFYYDRFGPPGTVASRDHDETLGLDRLMFANGVRLNLRPSSLEPGHFRLLVNFAQNAAAVPRNRPGLAELAAAVFNTAHTGKHLENELKRLLQLHGVTREFSVTFGIVHFSFSGPSRELPFTLRLLAALLSDLKPDEMIFRQDVARYHAYRGAVMSDVTRRALLKSLAAASDNDPRLELPPVEQVSGYEFKEVLRWMDTWWLRGPVEIGIVGDFAPDVAVSQAAATLGALPQRIAPKSVPPLTSAHRAAHHNLAAPIAGGSATSLVLWALDGDEDPRTIAARDLANDILRDRLRTTLREQLGATYSPRVGLQRDRLQRDFAFVWMINTFKPDQADRFTAEAIALATRFAKEGATAEEFARLREPARARHAENLRDNGWWLGAVVASAQTQPAALPRARAHATVVDSLTLDDVNRAARLFATPAIVTLVRPGAAK